MIYDNSNIGVAKIVSMLPPPVHAPAGRKNNFKPHLTLRISNPFHVNCTAIVYIYILYYQCMTHDLLDVLCWNLF